VKPYDSGRAALLPVNELSLQIAAGETLGLVGEAGSGKTRLRAGCVSVGAQVLLLLQELQKEFHLTDLFISHSLPVVAQLASHIAVMRAGQLIEYGPAHLILHEPTQPYTRDLLAAVPEIPQPGQV